MGLGRWDQPESTFDYVVVGGGTAGAVVARRLAEDADVRVAVLEAGPPDEGREEILDLGRWMELLESEYDEQPAIEPQPRGNGNIIHSRARVLGGCSSHNSSIAFGPPPADFADWEAAGAAGWGPDAVAPYFARVLQRVNVEVPTSDMPALEAVLDACEGMGLPRQRYDTEHVRDGCGRLALAVRGRRRQSSSVAYLHPLSQLPANLELRTETRALQLLLDGAGRDGGNAGRDGGSAGRDGGNAGRDGGSIRAVGVRTDRGDVRAEREVVVCLGTFQTPALLLRSGIGPADHLRELGIDVRCDLRGVGEHLMDHPEGIVMGEATRPLPDDAVQHWDGAVFATVVGHEDPRPDLMLHIGVIPFDTHTTAAGYPTAEHAISLTPNVCRARSRGTVRLRTAEPPKRGASDLAIDFAYFTDADGYDEHVMLGGAKLAREILARPELSHWVRRELAPGPDVTDDAALSHYIRTTANTVYHPMGTAKIGGADDPEAVVDPQLRVRGIEGLRIADASVFPAMVTTNPMITCMMIGERCADLLRA